MCNVGSGFSPSTHRVEGENNQHIPGERSGKMMDVRVVERVAKRKAVETGDSSQAAGVAVFLAFQKLYTLAHAMREKLMHVYNMFVELSVLTIKC